MIDNKIIPAHLLRLYTWELLQQNMGLEKITVRDPNTGTTSLAIPVIPLGDEPMITDSNKTYLVYGYAEQNAVGLKEIKRGSFSLRIVTPHFSTLGEVTTILLRAFENLDVSANHVNDWSSHYSVDFEGIRFTSLEVTYVEGGSPPTSESGPVGGLVNIGYNYISRQNVKTYSNGVWV